MNRPDDLLQGFSPHSIEGQAGDEPLAMQPNQLFNLTREKSKPHGWIVEIILGPIILAAGIAGAGYASTFPLVTLTGILGAFLFSAFVTAVVMIQPVFWLPVIFTIYYPKPMGFLWLVAVGFAAYWFDVF